jgi:uncharacterized protein (DUF885 family)
MTKFKTPAEGCGGAEENKLCIFCHILMILARNTIPSAACRICSINLPITSSINSPPLLTSLLVTQTKNIMTSPIASTISPKEFLHNEMSSVWQWRIDTDPELAASLGLLSQRRSTHAIDPRSPESFSKRLSWVKAALGRIQTLDESDVKALDKDDSLSYQLYVKELEDYVNNTSQYRAYLNCVNRLEGPQTDLVLYAKYLPLETQDQLDFYKQFLEGISVQLGEVIELLKLGLEEKRTPPQVSMDGVVKQLRAMVDGHCQAFSTFQDVSNEAWKKECCLIVTNQVVPAFTSFADFLEEQYIPNLRTEISAKDGYPDGERYYQDCLKFHTTTDMTAPEIHQLGLDEVARVQSEMQAIATDAGYDSLKAYMDHLRTSPDYAPSSTEALCAHYRDISGRIAPAMLKLFHVSSLPRTPFQIVETPPAHAAMAPAAYYLAGSADPSQPRPGTFYVNTSELPTRRLYECEALALHEAIPGHHTQAAVQSENTNLPQFRRYCEDRRYFEAPCRFPFYTGYIEGWGLHCETLGVELGLYKTKEDKFGQLSMEALRSCRLVVDTGMHYLGWSMEKALHYMLDHTAMGEHDARTEIARYITWPGQATAYKVGERVLFKLRNKAEKELGEELFDARDFYEVVLKCGPVPLEILEELLDSYISEIKAGEKNVGNEDNGKKVQSNETTSKSSFMDTMTFANWCKCCVVPGTCEV